MIVPRNHEHGGAVSLKLSSEEMTDIANTANKLIKTLFEVTRESTSPDEQIIIMIVASYILKKSLILNFDMLGQSEQGRKAIEIVEKYLEDNGVIKPLPFTDSHLN
jgi:hypothetical protein